PGDEQAFVADSVASPEMVDVPQELSMDLLAEDATTNLNGCGTLVYCADPRYSPHYPSFCTRSRAGCNNDKAFDDAVALCRSVCSPRSMCDGPYYVLGRC